MRTVEIDDDVFLTLEFTSRFTRVSIPQIVRKLVMQLSPDVDAPTGGAAPGSPRQKPVPNPRDKSLRDFAESPGFLANRSVVDKFLGVLSFLQKQNPDRFQILESMEGRKRKYIATSEQELRSSGTSVNPKRIPNTGFWVVTNNDTNNKKALLRQALLMLGYGFETVRSVPESLR